MAFDPPALPDGLTARPLRLEDVGAVVDVLVAEQLADLGRVLVEEADVLADWQRPSVDLAATTVGVLDGDRLVAWAELMGDTRSDAAVHPAYHGRGIGTALAGWLQRGARDSGQTEVGMPVLRGSAGDRLLAGLGYRVRWESWELFLPEGTQVPVRPLPPGYAVRAATPADHRACWTVIEDAFLEWSVRERQSFEDFLAAVVGRPGFEPWHLRVVTDPSGEVVAVVEVFVFGGDEGWVNRIATRADQRGRGLAQALLVDAFAAARARGAVRSGLSTDSRTGALGLYEKVGMVVTSTWVNRAIAV